MAYNGPKGSKTFNNTKMSYKSGASYNSPGHIRRPSAHTQREADIWGESGYIYAVQIYKGRVQILSISHLAGRMQDAKSIVQFVHLLQHSLTLADMKQARMLQAT